MRLSLFLFLRLYLVFHKCRCHLTVDILGTAFDKEYVVTPPLRPPERLYFTHALSHLHRW